MKKQRIPPLSRVPKRMPQIRWQGEEGGTITLLVENTGWANRLAQLLFRRPRQSRVDLDGLGSFVWQQMDGVRDVACLGRLLEERFGDAASPVYQRLVNYLQILYSYGFIRWV